MTRQKLVKFWQKSQFLAGWRQIVNLWKNAQNGLKVPNIDFSTQIWHNKNWSNSVKNVNFWLAGVKKVNFWKSAQNGLKEPNIDFSTQIYHNKNWSNLVKNVNLWLKMVKNWKIKKMQKSAKMAKIGHFCTFCRKFWCPKFLILTIFFQSIEELVGKSATFSSLTLIEFLADSGNMVE